MYPSRFHRTNSPTRFAPRRKRDEAGQVLAPICRKMRTSNTSDYSLAFGESIRPRGTVLGQIRPSPITEYDVGAPQVCSSSKVTRPGATKRAGGQSCRRKADWL
jgi:hypothetical protein